MVSLPVEDEPGPGSLRGYIERNAIALLSNLDRPPLDRPSVGWLGHHSASEEVRGSGLWNVNHVNETHHPDFIDRFDALVAGVTRARATPSAPAREQF